MMIKKMYKKLIIFLIIVSFSITGAMVCFSLDTNEIEDVTIESENEASDEIDDYVDEIESESETNDETEIEESIDDAEINDEEITSEEEILEDDIMENDDDIESSEDWNEPEMTETIESETNDAFEETYEEELEEDIISETTSSGIMPESNDETGIVEDEITEESEEDTINELEEDTATESIEEIESSLALASPLSLPVLGVGSDVYWYLKNTDTELHLSGTLPTDPDYVAGHDNYPLGFPNSAKATTTKVVIDNTVNPTSCMNWFNDFQVLSDIENIHLINTSNVNDMRYMFYQCEALTSLDLSTFNTQNVTRMDFMFYLCSNLADLNIYNFNTQNVTNMDDMFFDCYALTDLDISSFDVSSLTSAMYMFSNSGLHTIHVSPSFNIPASCLAISMFDNCTNLEGENGTIYDPAHTDGLYARIDAPGTPGYFTKKIRESGNSTPTTHKKNKEKKVNMPYINEEAVVTRPTGFEVVGIEGYNIGSAKYCYFYTWDNKNNTSKVSNYIYNNADGKFYRSDLSYVSNEWVGFSFYGGRIVWYYTGADGNYIKNSFSDINGCIYYFDNTGKMAVGWKDINNKEYYFQELVDRYEGTLNY